MRRVSMLVTCSKESLERSTHNRYRIDGGGCRRIRVIYSSMNIKNRILRDAMRVMSPSLGLLGRIGEGRVMPYPVTSFCAPRHHRKHRRVGKGNVRVHAAATGSQAISNAGFWSILVSAYSSDPVGVLLASGACIAAVALAVAVAAAIPMILAFRRSAIALEYLLDSLQDELPDTAAAVRLSSLEVADAVEEITGLGSDLSAGLRASARAILNAEEGVRGAGKFMNSVVVPSVKQKVPEAREKVEDALKERASLEYTEPTLREAAAASKVAIQRLRMALGGASLMSTAWKSLPRRYSRQNQGS